MHTAGKGKEKIVLPVRLVKSLHCCFAEEQDRCGQGQRVDENSTHPPHLVSEDSLQLVCDALPLRHGVKYPVDVRYHHSVIGGPPPPVRARVPLQVVMESDGGQHRRWKPRHEGANTKITQQRGEEILIRLGFRHRCSGTSGSSNSL